MDRVNPAGDGAVLQAWGLAVGRAGRVVVGGIDLGVAPGEQIALVGANGCGKTTLLRALAGLDRPVAGEIAWQGGPLPPGPARARTLGVLFQNESPAPFTTAETVALGLGLDGLPGDEDRRRVQTTLAQMDLTTLALRACRTLSGGEWQRAGLGRALVAGARLLLLDEPTSHLDPARRAHLRRLLDALRPDVAVVLATHDLEQAATCDRVLLLSEGRPLALGPPATVLTPAHLARALGVTVRRIEDPQGGPPLFRLQTPTPAPAQSLSASRSLTACLPSPRGLPRGEGKGEGPAPLPGGQMTTAVLVVGHGSREDRANREFEALVAGFRARLGARVAEVAQAYVELATPLLDDALAALAARHRTVVVLPLFLFLVGHAKNDVPLALARARAAHPAVRFLAGRELGIHTVLLQLLYERAAAALPPGPTPVDAAAQPPAPDSSPPPRDEAARTIAIVLGRGSSDPDANAEFCKLARLFGEGRGFAAVLPAFVGITTPLLNEALELAARARPGRILIVPHLLFAGRLIERITADAADFAARYPWIRTTVAAHLGPDPRLLEVLEQRLADALAGSGGLPCDTCQYRVPVAGVASQVGGLRALLWSVRHGFTHGQAAPHKHAHPPVRRHVLVCGNIDCASAGSLALLDGLRRLIKRAGRQREIRVTRTSCMGRCGEGPTVAIYPDGVWYRAVRPSDAPDLVREHLLGDRLVARLVDNIMQ
jgi:sirohydrochlorin cobaltochelatase